MREFQSLIFLIAIMVMATPFAWADYSLYQQTVLDNDDLFAYWTFDNDTGVIGSTAYDETGVYNGTYSLDTYNTGNAAWQDNVAIVNGATFDGATNNKAADFSGITSYIDAGTLGSLGSSLGDGVTIEMWVKSSYDGVEANKAGTNSQGRPIGSYDSASNSSILVSFDESGDDYVRAGGKTVQARYHKAEYDTDVTDGTWNYVAVTMDFANNNINLYTADEGDTYATIQSFPVQSGYNNTVSSFTDFAGSLFIGAANRLNQAGYPASYAYAHYEGLIDELAIYQGVQTVQQIDARLHASTGASYPGPTAEVAIDFDVEADLSRNFTVRYGSSSAIVSGHKTGAGSGGDTGYAAFDSTVAVEYIGPDGALWPDNDFKNVKYSVDFKFEGDATTTEKQYFGMILNIDDESDALVLQLRNVDHAGDPSDHVRLRVRNEGDGSWWGEEATIEECNVSLPLKSSTVNDWLRMEVTLENDQNDEFVDLSLMIVDLADDSVVFSKSWTGLEYGVGDLANIASSGGLGLISNDSNGGGVKWDNFTVTALSEVPEPSTIALLLAGLGSLLIWRRK